MMAAPRANVSWVDGHGHRLFGTFVCWDPKDSDYAICRTAVGRFKARIHKSNLTYECG
ncbi:hypothetical protein PBI_NILO_45 [Mycobacterium phage Nilo]|uniref:Uncharacterized protein n=1 Tax=Mycobacterium phage Nilo TaxID=2108129 RepID=A0A2P1JQM5_9CAUD|nr:hypothetical protein PBI_NILO_45 [Mycobacterium phage Nilo]